MNKTPVFCLLGLLCGCISSGPHNFFGARNDLVESFSTYSVELYDREPRLVKTELIEEKNFKLNTNLTAYKGSSVLNNKIYRKDYYRQEQLKADKDAVLNSASVPLVIKADKPLNIIGETDVDGVRYRLLPTQQEGFVMLVDSSGKIYRKIGQLRDGRLSLLLPDFLPAPEDVRFFPVKTAKTEQTKPTAGFDVKYDGVRLDRVWFTYFDYSGSADGNRGTFENISFPAKPGLVTIDGIGFRILSADDKKIDYVVIKDGD